MKQRDIPELIVHTPIMPPRATHIGEQVYAERWEELMASMPADWSFRDWEDDGVPVEVAYLHHILSYVRLEANQRAAHVAASLVCWCGTSCGMSFLRSIEKLRPLLRSGAGQAAWALENAVRSPAVNNGIRTLEYLLAGPECWKPRTYVGEYPFIKMPELTVFDFDVAAEIAGWLANEGKGFVVGCEREISRREKFDAIRREAQGYARVFLSVGRALDLELA